MEGNRIPIFDKLRDMWDIMPYYSHTHNAFILLSSLSQGSRTNLKRYYEAFLNWMEPYLIEVEIRNENIERRYSLPLYLFKFKIIIRSKENMKYFKRWIMNININS